MHRAPTCIHRDKIKNNCDLCFYVLFLFVMLCMIMKSDINNLICILFVHLSFIILEKNIKDCTLITPEILEFIELHTYKFGLG